MLIIVGRPTNTVNIGYRKIVHYVANAMRKTNSYENNNRAIITIVIIIIITMQKRQHTDFYIERILI